jgi:hypothetical protein
MMSEIAYEIQGSSGKPNMEETHLGIQTREKFNVGP